MSDYPEGHYTFTDGNGGTVVDGKVYYPSAITVHIGRPGVIRILRQIANSPLLDGEPCELTLSFTGTLERVAE